MFDLVRLQLKAGNGGNGKVAFRREKFVPKGGPDGGNGGDGGSIYVVGNRHLNTLQHYAGAKSFSAAKGEDGGSQNQIGHKSDDLILEVPIGTTIWLLAENKISYKRRIHLSYEGNVNPRIQLQKYYLDRPSGNPPARLAEEIEPINLQRNASVPQPLATQDESNTDVEHVLRSSSLKNVNIHRLPKVKLVEITADGQKVLLTQGGIGGRGNVSFKAADKTTPMEAEYGSFGEEKIVLFELRLLADVGLIGYPNAGKSTLLSVLTKANPKIANYPFTTLEPNLGVMSVVADSQHHSRDIVLADLPGIIEGANQGKGLGFDFLRHAQACQALLMMLTLDEETLFNEALSEEEKAALLFAQYQTLFKELQEFDPGLLAKKLIVSVSKRDLYPQALVEKIKFFFQQHDLPLIFFSTITRDGIDELQRILAEVVFASDKL